MSCSPEYLAAQLSPFKLDPPPVFLSYIVFRITVALRLLQTPTLRFKCARKSAQISQAVSLPNRIIKGKNTVAFG